MVSLLSSPFQFECMHCTQTNASTTHVQVLVASDCNGDWKRHSWLALNRPIKKGSWCNDGTMVAIKNDELIEVDVWCGLIFIWYRMSASANIWCPGRNTISCASSAREATVDWMSFQANLHSNIGNSNRTDYMSGGCIAMHSLSLNWLLVGLVFTLVAGQRQLHLRQRLRHRELPGWETGPMKARCKRYRSVSQIYNIFSKYYIINFFDHWLPLTVWKKRGAIFATIYIYI